MKDLVEYIVKNIVNNPDAVVVDESIDQDGAINLALTVDPSDMGLVIGKSGQTIKAIRKLLITRAMAENKRVSLFLNEPATLDSDNEPEVPVSDNEQSGEKEPVKAGEEISESKDTETPDKE